MPNKNYLNGRAKEYRIAKKWHEDGWTVWRTAGSHGEVDLICIKQEEKDLGVYPYVVLSGKIVLIQSKGGKSGARERKKLEPLKLKYDGLYSLSVEIV